ncbi:biliverdin-producing heme oxygenase [Bordetella genomosp. 9]|uniref:Heme oxygenase n=1 Tax=Bordetella genomosp. 9 TaxID=1416803 RepID=A0A1W6Z1P9_9BORD|nr:biliverdin-producing heme oxygenase [Bordetella genomosp. 9]ARP86753.1 hypothetical protein CAL13_11450 [Bordetella genomosp. 9]
MDVHATLRDATRDRHERLDRSLRIASPEATYEDYIAYLAALCGWLQPLEASLWARPWPPALQAARRRDKAARIQRDFEAARAAGMRVPAVPMCPALPDVTGSQAYALGVMYVIEGSQLGGRMMAKRFAAAWPAHRFHYLDGYGPDLGALWKDFTSFLASALRGPEDVNQAVAGACDAFDTLTDWLRRQGQ